MQFSNWIGIAAPAKVPADVLDKLHAEIMRAMTLPQLRNKLLEGGYTIIANRRDEFVDLVRRDAAMWADMVKAPCRTPTWATTTTTRPSCRVRRSPTTSASSAPAGRPGPLAKTACQCIKRSGTGSAAANVPESLPTALEKNANAELTRRTRHAGQPIFAPPFANSNQRGDHGPEPERHRQHKPRRGSAT